MSRRVCLCDPTRGESCPVDDGTDQETAEYWDRRTTRAQRRTFDRAMGAWWLHTVATTNEMGIST